MAYSELHDLERKMRNNFFNSTPKKKIPKKYILHNSHYTKEFLLMYHQEQSHRDRNLNDANYLPRSGVCIQTDSIR